jgi:hypothetical protein
MLAVVVLFSVLTGAVGFGAMQWMGFSVWVSLIGYPVFGSLGLIGGAALAAAGSQAQRVHATVPAPRPATVRASQAR